MCRDVDTPLISRFLESRSAVCVFKQNIHLRFQRNRKIGRLMEHLTARNLAAGHILTLCRSLESEFLRCPERR
jgi:hypothetical protein